MGFSTVLSSALVYMSLAIAVGVLGFSLYSGINAAIGEAMQDEVSNGILGDIELRIYNITVDANTGLPQYVEVLNAGSIPIWDFEKSHVIVELINNATGDRKTVVLLYGTGFQPVARGVLDATTGTRIYYAYSYGGNIYPGETVVIQVSIDPAQVGFTPDEVVVKFVYASGDSASTRFLV